MNEVSSDKKFFEATLKELIKQLEAKAQVLSVAPQSTETGEANAQSASPSDAMAAFNLRKSKAHIETLIEIQKRTAIRKKLQFRFPASAVIPSNINTRIKQINSSKAMPAKKIQGDDKRTLLSEQVRDFFDISSVQKLAEYLNNKRGYLPRNTQGVASDGNVLIVYLGQEFKEVRVTVNITPDVKVGDPKAISDVIWDASYNVRKEDLAAQNEKIAKLNNPSESEAMRTDIPVIAPANKGGIDLNTSNGMKWKDNKDGLGVQMDVDPAMVSRIERDGIDWLSPVT